jgi:cytochrome b561
VTVAALRAWAARYTRDGRYTPVGIAFHWVMAALVLFQLGWGFYTDWLMPGGDKVRAYQVHSAAGLPVLLLAVLRVGWRLLVPGPENDADRLGWQTTVAHVTHVLFYVCFFGLPLSGWVMWSAIAAPGPLLLAGVVPWPQVPLEELALEQQMVALAAAESVHRWLVILLLLLTPAHVAAALKHHFWDRDDVLHAMLPEVPDEANPRPAPRRTPTGRRLRKESEAG